MNDDDHVAFGRRSALAAIGLGGMAALTSNGAVAAAAATSRDLGQAVEALRLAMVEGDGKALHSLLDDSLIYMHSSGNSQTKADVLRDLAGKSFFASLSYSETVLNRAGETGIALLTVDQVKNLAGGGTRASRIKVLQTWIRAKGGWRLLARSSALIVARGQVGQRPVSHHRLVASP